MSNVQLLNKTTIITKMFMLKIETEMYTCVFITHELSSKGHRKTNKHSNHLSTLNIKHAYNRAIKMYSGIILEEHDKASKAMGSKNFWERTPMNTVKKTYIYVTLYSSTTWARVIFPCASILISCIKREKTSLGIIIMHNIKRERWWN